MCQGGRKHSSMVAPQKAKIEAQRRRKRIGREEERRKRGGKEKKGKSESEKV